MAGYEVRDIFAGPLFAIVTGGSQGFGRSIVVGLAVKASRGSVIAITARNKGGLEQTADLAKAKRNECNLGNGVQIICVASDVSSVEDVKNLVKACVGERRSSDFTSALLIHNAGSLGDISKEICDFQDPCEVNDYYKLNVAHIPPLTGKFMEWANTQCSNTKTVIVNISSLLALNPSPCFGLYASGKAAREMLFRVLAAESPQIKVLNYAPGPLYTPMSEKIWSTPNRHGTDQYMRSLRDDGKYVTCEQSTAKLLEILRRNNYSSGSHVDYFD